MRAEEIGEVTVKMFERQEGEPPALIREWGSKLQRAGQFILLWTGVVRREWGDLGWGCLSTSLGREATGKAVPNISAAKVERMLAPLAHEGRIAMMQVLFERALPAGELSKVTGLRGGGLYHHLRELQHSGYVKREGGCYGLTRLGCQLLVSVLCMADEVIEDRGEEGLEVGAKWSEGVIR